MNIPEQSVLLSEQIKTAINANGGKISFVDYMQLALFTPGLGYYTSATRKFGEQGDFVTAPEISPLYSQCLARQCQQVLDNIAGGSILEFGAGTGVMAADILKYLNEADCLPEKYFILELSADLQQRQQQLIQQRCPEIFDRVEWLSSMPFEKFSGVVLANEVLDAMPVHRFKISDDNVYESFVSYDENLHWCYGEPSNELKASVQAIKKDVLNEVTEYESEINLNIAPWLQSINDVLERGVVLLIDYGFPRSEFYHPSRTDGTLMCHYQHRSHPDPFFLPGLQDITAHVDFTCVAECADEIDFDVSGYTTQAYFLLSCGITELAQTEDIKQQMQFNTAIKKLTMPEEMGELFKVMALSKGIEDELLGFSFQDMRFKL